jgi:hypothetical protein
VPVREREHGPALALAATVIDLILGILLWATYEVGGEQWQFVEDINLFGRFAWALGIDGIALMLIMLSVFLMPICILASQSITSRVQEYMASFLMVEVLMLGVFMAQDIFLFYIFFEAGLIPMYLIIGIWGGANRIYAAYKFFLYTLLGSVLMLIAILWMVQFAGTTSIPLLLTTDFPPRRRPGCSWPSSPASRSSCRCGRSTPGCPTRTSRRRRRLGDPGGRAAEARRLRLHPLLAADVSRSFQRIVLAGHGPQPGRDRLHQPRCARAAGHEEADRLFVCRAHGVRDHRLVRDEPAGD